MKACPDLATLRAGHRGELGWEQAQAVRDHLAGCRSCRAVDRELRSVGGQAGDRRGGFLSTLTGVPRWLSVAGAMAAIVLLALLTLPPVRSAADDLIGKFRVQSFAVVKLDPSTLRDLPAPQDLGTLSGTAPKFTKVASLSEAGPQVGFKVRTPGRLPSGLSGPNEIAVSSATQMIYTLDEAKLRAYLATLGATSMKLPAADQLKITANVPSGVVMGYTGSAGELVFAQGPSPSLEVPKELDVVGLREQFLAAAPAELAAQIRNVPDWNSTAVLPAPPSADTRTLGIDGTTATLVTLDGKRVLLWQRDGILYGLFGTVSEADLLEVANSLVGR